jgi:peptidoglycan/xylan/chitin deacetylase (PgdA/CDA1 family)
VAFAAAGVVVLVLVGATLAFRIGTSAATRSPAPSQIGVASAATAVASAATNAPAPSPTPSPAITAAPSPTLPPANTYPLVNSCDPSSVPWAIPVTTPAVGKVGTFVLQVPVLMYHRIVPAAEAGNSIPGLVVAPEIFSAQLDALQKGGWHTITMARLATDLQAHIKPPPKTFVITIDDGWDDGYTYALPVLAKHGFVATYFVIAGRIDAPDFLSSAHLRTLIGAGDEIGDHTMDHDLAGQTADKLKYEIDAAAARIAQVTGVWPESLAYPSGGVDTAAAAAVAACGELRTAVIEAPPASTAVPSPTPVPSSTSGLTPAPSPTPRPTAAPSASAAPAAALPAAALMAATTTMPAVYETWATRWTIPRLRVTPSTVPAYLLAELNHYS